MNAFKLAVLRCAEKNEGRSGIQRWYEEGKRSNNSIRLSIMLMDLSKKSSTRDSHPVSNMQIALDCEDEDIFLLVARAASLTDE